MVWNAKKCCSLHLQDTPSSCSIPASELNCSDLSFKVTSAYNALFRTSFLCPLNYPSLPRLTVSQAACDVMT